MNLKDKLTTGAQQALAIDDVRNKIDAVIGHSERVHAIEKNTYDLLTGVEQIKAALQRIADTIGGPVIELSENIHARVRRADDDMHKLEEHVSRLQFAIASLQEKAATAARQGEAAAQELANLARQNDARSRALGSLFEQGMARYHERLTLTEPWLPEEALAHSEPEYYLAAFLYSFLPNRVAVDVGANQGDFMQVAADAGYEVFSFEPFPAAFQKLRARSSGRKNVKVFNFALGSVETSLPLHVATESGIDLRGDASLYNTFRPHFVRDNIQFDSTVEVPVRTISALVEAGEIPAAIDFLKVDTEGFDLEVIKGLGDLRPQIVQTEFWGKGFVFVRNEPDPTLLVNSREVIENMRGRGYLWNLVVFRVEGSEFVRLATNLAEAPPRTWGNILFFREHAIYREGFRWAQGSLPRFQNPV
ncbi:MAG TPA: FkbM family methyltransferase [Chthoniobacterales bacterium]